MLITQRWLSQLLRQSLWRLLSLRRLMCCLWTLTTAALPAQ